MRSKTASTGKRKVASGGDTVRSVLLPDLTLEAARVFELP